MVTQTDHFVHNKLGTLFFQILRSCLPLAFFACFWAYVGQPHNHIGWATLMPFASINSTNQRTNPWNFREKILRIGGAGKWAFFNQPFWFFFSMKTTLAFIWGIIFFCTMGGFFRILEKTSSELICTQL